MSDGYRPIRGPTYPARPPRGGTTGEDPGERVNALGCRLPTPLVHEWTCGHVAASVCAECWRDLAQRANELAEENLELIEMLTTEQLAEVRERQRQRHGKA